MRIGVVILNWNGRHLLADCIDSVLADGSAEASIYVADNASEDGSVAWLRECYGQVRVVENPSNLRFAEGNNAGARAAIDDGCELLLLLNNDAQLEPGALGALHDAFAADARLGAAGPRIVYAKDPGRIWYGGGIARLGLGYFAHRAIRKPVGRGVDPAGDTDWVTGCALATRSELFAQLGGLDASYFIYAEDVDYSLRLRALGRRVAYVPAATVRHAVSASVGGHASAFKLYHQARSRRQLIDRHARGAQRGVALLGSLGQDWLRALALLLRGRWGAAAAALRGFWDAPRGILRYRAP